MLMFVMLKIILCGLVGINNSAQLLYPSIYISTDSTITHISHSMLSVKNEHSPTTHPIVTLGVAQIRLFGHFCINQVPKSYRAIHLKGFFNMNT